MRLGSKIMWCLVALVCSAVFSSGQSIDTGNCCLAVDTSLACAIGNFQYPKYTPSIIFASSMLLGHSESYVVDCWANQSDWRWVVGWTGIVPPLYGSEQTLGSHVDDGNHPAPRGIRARRYFVGRGSRHWPAFDDFAVLIYNYINPTDSTIRGLYAGVVVDFDLGTAPTSNVGRTDPSRRFTYMQPSSGNQNPTVGVRLLYPRTAANNSLVDHALYLYPPGQPSELTKMRFLNGTIRLENSTRPYDYSIFVSAGPFDFQPRDSSIWVVYGLVGGADSATARIHSDSAQSWCDREMVRIEEKRLLEFVQARVARLRILQNPSVSRNVWIRYSIPGPSKAKLVIYNSLGQIVEVLLDGEVKAGVYEKVILKDLDAGVYFISLQCAGRTITGKLVIVE